METTNTNRIAYWDNLKAVLIFLVVLGHFLLPVASERGRVIEAVYTWIYLFHMPAFIFVSGHFSKSYVRKGASDIRRLIGFLVLYVLYCLADWAIEIITSKSLYIRSIFSPTGAQWYLLCMFLWYLLIPHCAKIRPWIMLLLSIITGLLVGADYRTGAFLSLSRCIVFLPFFLAGYFFDGSLIAKIKPWMKAISGVILLLALLTAYLCPDFFAKHITILYGDSPYSSITSGIIERFVWYIVAIILITALFCVIPHGRNMFTYIGQRTLAVYIFHRLIRTLLLNIGIYNIFSSETETFTFCLTSSVVLTFILSEKHLSEFVNKAFTAKYGWLLK